MAIQETLKVLSNTQSPELQKLYEDKLKRELYEEDYVKRTTGYTPKELEGLALKHAIEGAGQQIAPQGVARVFQGTSPEGTPMLTDQPQAGFVQRSFRTGGDYMPGQQTGAQGGVGSAQAAIMAAAASGQVDPQVAKMMLTQVTPKAQKQPKQSEVIAQEKYQREQQYNQTLAQIRQMERAVKNNPELKESIQPALEKLNDELFQIDSTKATKALKEKEAKMPKLTKDIAIQIASQGPEWAKKHYGTDFDLTQAQANDLLNTYSMFSFGGGGLEAPPEPGETPQAAPQAPQAPPPQQAAPTSMPIDQRMQAPEPQTPMASQAPPERPEDYVAAIKQVNPWLSDAAAQEYVRRAMPYQRSQAGMSNAAVRG